MTMLSFHKDYKTGMPSFVQLSKFENIIYLFCGFYCFTLLSLPLVFLIPNGQSNNNDKNK